MPLSATINALPTTTISIVKADLAFLSLSASNDNIKICLIFLFLFCFSVIFCLCIFELVDDDKEDEGADVEL
jgi:hypothetical protein